MNLVEFVLVAYSRFYVRNLPLSAKEAIPDLAPLERKITELFENKMWRCDSSPTDVRFVVFSVAREIMDGDLRPLFIVDANLGTVTCYEPHTYKTEHYKAN